MIRYALLYSWPDFEPFSGRPKRVEPVVCPPNFRLTASVPFCVSTKFKTDCQPCTLEACALTLAKTMQLDVAATTDYWSVYFTCAVVNVCYMTPRITL